MRYSKRCLDLVKRWEGYHKLLPNGDCTAYPDVGSVDGEPITIGYGTTKYSSAGLQKYIRTKVQMGDTLTKQQAESELVAELDSVASNTLALTNKLNQNQFDACVSFFYNCGFPLPQVARLRAGELGEFAMKMLEYIKGGDGQVLQGLVNRRNEEYQLFNLVADIVTLKEATWFEFYRAQTPTVIAWAGSEPLHKLESKSVDDLVEFFATHRQAKTFAVAPADKKIPTLQKPVPEPDIEATCTLTRYKDAVTMPIHWRSAGLKPLCLKIATEEWLVVSGQGYAQNFRKPENTLSYPGNMEPIPQGDYSIGLIEFANGKDNYTGSWGPGLGPVWVALTAQFPDDRSAFGFHLDMNIVTSPGSAGCVVFSSVADLKSFVNALRIHDPKKLSVNWGI